MQPGASGARGGQRRQFPGGRQCSPRHKTVWIPAVIGRHIATAWRPVVLRQWCEGTLEDTRAGVQEGRIRQFRQRPIDDPRSKGLSASR